LKRSDIGQKAPASPDRREFIKKSGRFAAAAPAVTFLLSTSLASEAVARSGGGAASSGERGRRGGLGGFLSSLFRWIFGG